MTARKENTMKKQRIGYHFNPAPMTATSSSTQSVLSSLALKDRLSMKMEKP